MRNEIEKDRECSKIEKKIGKKYKKECSTTAKIGRRSGVERPRIQFSANFDHLVSMSSSETLYLIFSDLLLIMIFFLKFGVGLYLIS